MNRMLWPLGILILIGSLVGAGWALNHTTPQPGADSKDDVKNAPPSVVVCLGLVDVEKGVAELYPKQFGEVVEIADTQTPDGKERVFKKGDMLLRIKSQMAEHLLGKARAAVRAAEADLDKAKTLEPDQKIKLATQQEVIRTYGHEKAKVEAELENKKRLAKENIGDISKDLLKAMQEAVSALESRVKVEQLKLDELKLFDPNLEIRRAAADLDAKRLDVKIAEQNLKDFQVDAPFDGTVLRFHTRLGEALFPSARGPAIEFCPDAPRIVRAEVIQEWGHRVHVGLKATIEDDSYMGPVWEGEVKSVAEAYQQKKLRIIEPFMTNDARTLECIVSITAGQSPVRIGQRVRVKIKI
jgi:multidrug resistance efflux pump